MPAGAPPTSADTAPRPARNTSEASATQRISCAGVATHTTAIGNAAPTAKLAAEASGACVGRAAVVGEKPSSSPRRAPSAGPLPGRPRVFQGRGRRRCLPTPAARPPGLPSIRHARTPGRRSRCPSANAPRRIRLPPSTWHLRSSLRHWSSAPCDGPRQRPQPRAPSSPWRRCRRGPEHGGTQPSYAVAAMTFGTGCSSGLPRSLMLHQTSITSWARCPTGIGILLIRKPSRSRRNRLALSRPPSLGVGCSFGSPPRLDLRSIQRTLGPRSAVRRSSSYALRRPLPGESRSCP